MSGRAAKIILFLLLCLSLSIPAGAQTGSWADLYPPNTTNFPEISAQIKPFDSQGAFFHNLRPEDIIIFENQRPVAVSSLQNRQPGTQFITALSLERAFAIRDSNGISRYDTIVTTFSDWAIAQSAEANDDLSFVTADGYEATHLGNAQEWIQNIRAYDTDPRTAEPNLDVLSRAIDIASDPTPRPGMGRAVLFLTPVLPADSLGALTSLTSRAQQENVRISVWVVGSPSYFTSESATRLAALAAETGGDFVTFSGIEPLPDIDLYLEPLRYIYDLTYQSKITTIGTHEVFARIETLTENTSSNIQEFDLAVQPPNPIFLSPPQQIVRADQRDFTDSMNEAAPDFAPKSQAINILIEFPDGFERELVRTSLYVNGQLVVENTIPPFDQFTWDLEGYTTSGEHLLQVEAVDILGLNSLSIETPVQITIQQTPKNIFVNLARNAPLIAGAAVTLAGGILLLVLLLGGRIRPRGFGVRSTNGTSPNGRQTKPDPTDPVTQPVRVRSASSRGRLSSWVNRFSWPQRQTDSLAPAYLEPLDNQKTGSIQLDSIPLSAREITLGHDPTQATVSLDHPSIAALHARIRQDERQDFWLYDENPPAENAASGASPPNTWINYEPIPAQGTKLQHGDIIHIGRIGLIFSFSDTNRIPKLKVLPLDDVS